MTKVGNHKNIHWYFVQAVIMFIDSMDINECALYSLPILATLPSQIRFTGIADAPLTVCPCMLNRSFPSKLLTGPHAYRR